MKRSFLCFGLFLTALFGCESAADVARDTVGRVERVAEEAGVWDDPENPSRPANEQPAIGDVHLTLEESLDGVVHRLNDQRTQYNAEDMKFLLGKLASNERRVWKLVEEIAGKLRRDLHWNHFQELVDCPQARVRVGLATILKCGQSADTFFASPEPEAVVILEKLLKDRDVRVRYQAAMSLLSHNNRSGRAVFLDAFEKVPDLRPLCEIFEKWRIVECYDMVAAKLKQDAPFKPALITLLGELGNPRARSELVNHLDPDPASPLTQYQAALALLKLLDRAGMEILRGVTPANEVIPDAMKIEIYFHMFLAGEKPAIDRLIDLIAAPLTDENNEPSYTSAIANYYLKKLTGQDFGDLLGVDATQSRQRRIQMAWRNFFETNPDFDPILAQQKILSENLSENPIRNSAGDYLYRRRFDALRTLEYATGRNMGEFGPWMRANERLETVRKWINWIETGYLRDKKIDYTLTGESLLKKNLRTDWLSVEVGKKKFLIENAASLPFSIRNTTAGEIVIKDGLIETQNLSLSVTNLLEQSRRLKPQYVPRKLYPNKLPFIPNSVQEFETEMVTGYIHEIYGKKFDPDYIQPDIYRFRIELHDSETEKPGYVRSEPFYYLALPPNPLDQEKSGKYCYNWQGVVASYELYMRQNPLDAENWLRAYFLGRLCSHFGVYDRALKFYDMAIKFDPENPLKMEIQVLSSAAKHKRRIDDPEKGEN